MLAESAPRFRRVQLSVWLIAAAAICLLASLVLLGAGAMLADVLGRSVEPVLVGPFRWEAMAALS